MIEKSDGRLTYLWIVKFRIKITMMMDRADTRHGTRTKTTLRWPMLRCLLASWANIQQADKGSGWLDDSCVPSARCEGVWHCWWMWVWWWWWWWWRWWWCLCQHQPHASLHFLPTPRHCTLHIFRDKKLFYTWCCAIHTLCTLWLHFGLLRISFLCASFFCIFQKFTESSGS